MSTVEMSEGCEPFVAFYKRRAEAAEARVADLAAGIRSLIDDISGSYTGIGDFAIRDALRALVDDEETR